MNSEVKRDGTIEALLQAAGTEALAGAQTILQRLLDLSSKGIFAGQPPALGTDGQFVYNVKHLGSAERGMLIAWIRSQADERGALLQLKSVMQSMKFDITAAELSEFLHPPGNA